MVMIQEEKDILLKDLCCRLPYGVIIEHEGNLSRLDTIFMCDSISISSTSMDKKLSYNLDLNEVKPYLYPLSSITEEQRYELSAEHSKDAQILLNIAKEVCVDKNSSKRGLGITHYAEDWCNKNHFDYRNLIPMGLALDATDKNIY